MPLRLSFPTVLSGLLCLLFLSGCGSITRTDDPIAFAATTAQPLAIDVESFRGDVIIRANPNLEKAEVVVTRAFTNPALRDDEGRDSLDRITASAQMVDSELGPTLMVRAGTDFAEPHFQRAHVKITAPAVGDVMVRTSHGKVWVIDHQGPVDIANRFGHVRVMTHWPMLEPCSVQNMDGDIDFRVRAESQGAFDCAADGGKALVRALYGELLIHAGTRVDRLYATLNGGDNDIVLHTTDGNVRVAVVPNPTDVGYKIVDP